MDLSHRNDIEDCCCDACILRRHRKFRSRFWTSLLVLAILISVGIAVAQTPAPRTVALSLTAPTQFEDGSALNCTTPGVCTFNIYRGTCGGSKTLVVTGAVANTGIAVPNSLPGQCFAATAIASGSESAQSIDARYKGNPNSPVITVIVTVIIETPQ